MCGINGFTFGNEELIRQMNQLVKHRGPDDDGVFVNEQVSFGHTRLAILDLSPKGHQPMWSFDNQLVIVFNGEIYNFQDVRKELIERGYSFHSESDTEVLLAAYHADGPECLKKLNGIFAFAIWDLRCRELFVARDRVGVKPLYYCTRGKDLIFSSELKAILAHDIPRILDQEALNIYLRLLYVPAPLTMLRGIRKLEAGSYLLWRDGQLRQERYWQPSDFSDLATPDEAREQIRFLLKDAVRLQLISDRPVGVFLSGGIDSTVITALASEALGRQVKTFSVGFDIWPEKYNADVALARETSQHFGTDHHEFIITGKDAAETLPQVVYHMDEPVANATQIATYLLSKYTREQVVVCLGGDGGDELFGGYERYRLSRLISRFQRLPRVAQKTTLMFLLGEKGRGKREKFQIPPGGERYLAFMAQKESAVSRVLRQDYNNPDTTNKFYARQYFNSELRTPNSELNIDFEKHFMLADIRSWLVDESLIRTDKMSMAWGLEQRVPILDHRLLELALKIPTNWKIQGKNTKAIFKEALKEYLPEHVLRQPKRGWSSPASHWLRTDLKDLAYQALAGDYTSDTKEIFDFAAIRVMLDRHISKEEYQMNLLWALLHFQMWYRRFNISIA